MLYYDVMLLSQLLLSFIVPSIYHRPRWMTFLCIVHFHNLMIHCIEWNNLLGRLLAENGWSRPQLVVPNAMRTWTTGYEDCPNHPLVSSDLAPFSDVIGFVAFHIAAPYLNLLNIQCTIYKELLDDYLDRSRFMTAICQWVVITYFSFPDFSGTLNVRMDGLHNPIGAYLTNTTC